MASAKRVVTLFDMQSYLQTLAAGGLFGAAAGALLIGRGKIAGVSGILAGALQRDPRGEAGGWRLVFLLSLMLGGLIGAAIAPDAITQSHPVSLARLAVAGLLIGLGARIGNGCTSGHGICGVGRLSLRSSTAVATFTVAGALTHLALDRAGLG